MELKGPKHMDYLNHLLHDVLTQHSMVRFWLLCMESQVEYQSHSDLCWAMWYWSRLFSEYLGFALPPQASTIFQGDEPDHPVLIIVMVESSGSLYGLRNLASFLLKLWSYSLLHGVEFKSLKLYSYVCIWIYMNRGQ